MSNLAELERLIKEFDWKAFTLVDNALCSLYSGDPKQVAADLAKLREEYLHYIRIEVDKHQSRVVEHIFAGFNTYSGTYTTYRRCIKKFVEDGDALRADVPTTSEDA